MMNKETDGKNMVFAVVFALMVMTFAAPVFAQSQCLQSVDTSTSASRVTTGTSVTVTVTTTGTSCTVSTLVLVSSPSSQSVTNGNSFDLSIGIQNAQSSDVTTSYTLNLPSGLTRQSGDPASSSGTTVSASSTKTLSLNIKHSTCFEGIKLITFDLGGSTGVASVSVTGNASGTCSTANASSSSSSSGSGASGGGAAIKTTKAYSTGKATVSIPVIQGGATEIVDLDAGETTVRKIEITVKGIARSITVVIEQSKLPLGVPVAPGTISHYISITKTNVSDENIASGKLEFRLEKSWITGNKIDDSKVSR